MTIATNAVHGPEDMAIPKALAEAMGIRKGETVQWSFVKGDLVLKRIR